MTYVDQIVQFVQTKGRVRVKEIVDTLWPDTGFGIVSQRVAMALKTGRICRSQEIGMVKTPEWVEDLGKPATIWWQPRSSRKWDIN